MGKSPDAFRTISEVAALLDTPAHVLRFWESKFPGHIRPVKRAGGRRYYRPDDIALVAGVKLLLHDQGMTIRGVQKLLKERGPRYVASLSAMPWEGTEAGEPVEAVGDEEAAPDAVVVGPWPGAGEAEPEPSSEALVESYVRGVAERLVAQRDGGGSDLSLARLRGALAQADRARLGAEAGRIGPLVERLRALRDGPSQRSA